MTRIPYRSRTGPPRINHFKAARQSNVIVPSSPPCPVCGVRDNQVVDTRASDDRVRRRRQCVCGSRFTTYEIIAVEPALDYQI